MGLFTLSKQKRAEIPTRAKKENKKARRGLKKGKNIEVSSSVWYNLITTKKLAKEKNFYMAIIAQQTMFSWEKDIDDLGDLET